MVNWNLDCKLSNKRNNCFNLFQILGIICMICASPAYAPATHWFLFVIVTAFIATLLWCFIYLLSIREALKLPINWILTVKKQFKKNSSILMTRILLYTFIYLWRMSNCRKCWIRRYSPYFTWLLSSHSYLRGVR